VEIANGGFTFDAPALTFIRPWYGSPALLPTLCKWLSQNLWQCYFKLIGTRGNLKFEAAVLFVRSMNSAALR
jgi:hypothetical protein